MAIQNNENTMANLDKILTKNEGFRQSECWSDDLSLRNVFCGCQ